MITMYAHTQAGLRLSEQVNTYAIACAKNEQQLIFGETQVTEKT